MGKQEDAVLESMATALILTHPIGVPLMDGMTPCWRLDCQQGGALGMAEAVSPYITILDCPPLFTTDKVAPVCSAAQRIKANRLVSNVIAELALIEFSSVDTQSVIAAIETMATMVSTTSNSIMVNPRSPLYDDNARSRLPSMRHHRAHPGDRYAHGDDAIGARIPAIAIATINDKKFIKILSAVNGGNPAAGQLYRAYRYLDDN